MGTKSTLNAKNLRDQLKRILDYVRKNLRFIETDLSISGDTEIHSTLNVKPGGNSVFAVGESQVVINEASNDVDFRVESDAATHMLFVDGGNNRVSIGSSVDAPAAAFEVQSPATAGVPAVIIDNDDTDQFALQINAANIDASAMLIDADALTTAHAINITADALTTGSILNLVSDSGESEARSLVKIHQDNALARQTSLLELLNDMSSGASPGGHALKISTAQLINNPIQVEADGLTTGNVMDVSADALTTGSILNLVSDSSDNTARSLVNIINDNNSATNVTCLTVRNDSNMADNVPTVLIHDAGDMADDGHATLELRYGGGSAGRQASLEFNQATGNSSDDDDLGQILVTALDSADNKDDYCQINFMSSDRTSGDEGGKIQFKVAADGTAGTAGLKELFTIGGEDVANTVVPAVVVNEAGINCDFRVESDGEDEAIFLDASAETLYINKGETAFITQIHSTNDVAITVGAAGVIFNEDGHATNDLRVESDNNTHMLFVDASVDTVSVGFDGSLQTQGFAVANDFNATTFENQIVAGKHGSAEILRYSPGADDTLTSGQLFFLHTDGTWDSTDADAVATGATQMLGIGLGGSARTVGCLIKGFINIPSTEILNLPGSGAVDGLPLYVSTTAGHLDFTAPSGNNDFVRIVGYAIDDDSSNVLVYFNPDATHVEITA